MIARLAWLELRQQVGGRVFWIVFAVSVLMVVGGMGIDELRVGLAEEGARVGAAAIVRTHLVWSLFFLFTAAALVGEAVLRDQLTGFADLVRATPVAPSKHALGRFMGATGAVLLCFVSVPTAMIAGGVALGLGSGPPGGHLFAFFALAVPNLLLASALFYALAGVTRSMTGCLLGAAGLLTLYGIVGESGSGSSSVIEPFGFAAVTNATLSWSVTQRDADWPSLAGELLANRTVWLGVAAALVGLGTWLQTRRAARDDRSRRGATSSSRGAGRSTRERSSPASPRTAYKATIIVTQIASRSGLETRRIFLTPAFAALLTMSLATAAAAAAAAVGVSRVDGTPATIAALATSFRLVPVVVALFFAGELFWAEREHKVEPIITATPVAGAVLVLAKFLALALVLLSLASASAGAGAATEIAMGRSPAPRAYLMWYVLPQTYDWLLLAALAIFLQSLAPNKLAGWGYMVFYLIGSLALNKLGWQDPHYRYGGYPGAPLPPALSGAHDVGWYHLGWGLAAAAMIALACMRGLPQARSLRHPPPWIKR
ncbi:ABC transporter permease [Sphingomonas sp. DT-51]|uniref:ABC transporter permease n=1 Tax=Sphingomonas sp. DT-51 TaxID=3396165 RepID=UPI003F1B675C